MQKATPPEPRDEGYNFAYLDEQTKRMIRRAILKAVAVPGYQVPFGSREMPLSYGWGTGGVQVTAAVLPGGDPDAHHLGGHAQGHRPLRARQHGTRRDHAGAGDHGGIRIRYEEMFDK